MNVTNEQLDNWTRVKMGPYTPLTNLDVQKFVEELNKKKFMQDLHHNRSVQRERMGFNSYPCHSRTID